MIEITTIALLLSNVASFLLHGFHYHRLNKHDEAVEMDNFSGKKSRRHKRSEKHRHEHHHFHHQRLSHPANPKH